MAGAPGGIDPPAPMPTTVPASAAPTAANRHTIKIGMLARILILCSWAAALLAQNSLATRTLVVYASNDPDSISTAAYYQSRRGIPAANMCAVILPDPNATALNIVDYNNSVRDPVRSCLDAAGRERILYILLAYMRPYGIVSSSGLGYYALDSYLADLWDHYTTQAFDPVPTRTHPYYVDNQSQGNVYRPFQSLSAYRDLGTLPLIYSVWRLDGVTPAMAMSLVDKALAAEAAGGPISQISERPNACIDMVADPTAYPDTGYRSADWDLLRGSQFLSATGAFNIASDTLDTVFGEPPSPDCGNTGLYAGWYNYGRYVDAFSWDDGAIGWDLDSGALLDPRGGPWWGSNALARGVTVTSGPITEPYLEGLPRPSGVMLDLLRGANVGDAFLRNTRWLKWQMLNVGDPLYAPFVNAAPPLSAGGVGGSLSLRPRELVGGGGLVSAVVTIDTPAPAGGLLIDLSSTDPACAVPEHVTIPEGTTSTVFIADTSAVAASTDVVITAANPLMAVRNTVTLDPLLSDIGFSTGAVVGGSTVEASVFLNASAPLGGITVQLSSDQPGVAAVLPNAFVPGGLAAADFSITTSRVSTSVNVNITATYAGAAAVATLVLTP